MAQIPRPQIDAGRASQPYLPFIDGLRALAVLGVIFFHFHIARISGGYVGVDVFFVLSGYLITNLIDVRLRRQAFSFANFYERRARRILPALLITCAVCSIAALLLFVPHDFREFGKSLKAAAFFYSNVVFAQATGYFADPQSVRPLLHTWSLAVEEQFYLLFPPLLYAMYRAAGKNRLRLWAAMGVCAAISLALSIQWVKTDEPSAFYLLPSRAWELLAGALIALAPWQLRLSRSFAETLAVLGVLCIGFSFAAYDRNTPFPGTAALLPCAGTMLLILSNLTDTTRVGRMLSHRTLVYVGLISYGLYLYHWPILAFSRYFLDRELNSAEACAALAATLVLALVSYHCIEVPVRSGIFLHSRTRVFQTAAAGLVVIGAIGIAAVNGDGFPSRFSGAALQYAAAARDNRAWDKCMPAPERLDRNSICRFGNATAVEPSFLVWGDSHAAALAPGVDARAGTLGISGWVVGYNRCASLIGAAPMQHNRDDYPCVLIGEKVLQLVRDNQVKHILLASRWDTYISGWERGGSETLQDLTISYTADGRRTQGLEAFRLSFEETIRRLRALGADVWVLEQVPPQLVDVPSALAKAVYFGRNPDTLRRPYRDIEKRRAEAQAVFARFRDAPGVSFIDPADVFCPGKSPCLMAVHGRALYSDGNHLSLFGSRWSQQMLDPFFSSIIR
ncbi:MAG: acyltransferase family protein [Steroidobacteraceae bacterium]